LKKQENLQKV